jgi:hypothetical protein
MKSRRKSISKSRKPNFASKHIHELKMAFFLLFEAGMAIFMYTTLVKHADERNNSS